MIPTSIIWGSYKMSKLGKHILGMGTLATLVFGGHGVVNAQNSYSQDTSKENTENVVNKKNEGKSYANLAIKVWSMYVGYEGLFASYNESEKEKCEHFFEKHKNIKKYLDEINQKIGNIRGPKTVNVVRDVDPEYIDKLYKMLTPDAVKEMDGIRGAHPHVDNEKTEDIIWRMYTYTATHGGLSKKNDCTEFFNKYPELYDVCEDAAKNLKNKPYINLERTTYTDIMYYNEEWKSQDFDRRIGYAMYMIGKDRDISTREITRDAQDINIPEASQATIYYAPQRGRY